MQRNRMTRACTLCGSLIDRPPCQLRGERVFCGPECYLEYVRKTVPTPAEQFDRYVLRQASGCWLWTGPLMSNGYGRVRVAVNERVLAHRAAYALASGVSVPDDMEILHTCDTRACVRNDDRGTYEVNGNVLPRYGHLALGTHADNAVDMAIKGRGTVGNKNYSVQHPELLLRGEQAYRAVLTDEKVLEIRRRYAQGERQAALAATYGVAQMTISKLVRRITWSHLP